MSTDGAARGRVVSRDEGAVVPGPRVGLVRTCIVGSCGVVPLHTPDYSGVRYRPRPLPGTCSAVVPGLGYRLRHRVAQTQTTAEQVPGGGL